MVHGVFKLVGDKTDELIGLLDEAYEKIITQNIPHQVGTRTGNWCYFVNMGRKIGYIAGDVKNPNYGKDLTFIQVVFKPGTTEIVTSYPVDITTAECK